MVETQNEQTEPRRRRGRRSLLTPQRERRLLDAVQRGLSYRSAAAFGGISFDTFNRWRKQGQQEDASPEIQEFCNQLRMAEARAEDLMVRRIVQASKKQWQAAVWYLERRNPADWCKQPQIKVSAEEGSTLSREIISREVLSDEALLTAINDIQARIEGRIEKATSEQSKGSETVSNSAKERFPKFNTSLNAAIPSTAHEK